MSPKHSGLWAFPLCLSLLDANSCWAVDYTLQANAALRQDYTSNILLQPASLNPEGVWGTDLDVNTSVMAQAPTWRATGSARFDNWFYYPISTLNMQNQYLDGTYSYFTQRSRWDINANFISDAILSSQSDPTAGIVLGRIRRDMVTITPSWNYQLTEYTNVGLSYSYNNSSYPDNHKSASATALSQGAVYPDSDSHSLSATANHRATDKLLLNGGLSATTYQTSSNTAYVTTKRVNPFVTELITNSGTVNREINYLNINLGFKYAFWDDTEVSFSGGGQLSQTITDLTVTSSRKQDYFLGVVPLGTPVSAPIPPTPASRSPLQFGPLFNLAISKKFEQSTLGLVYGHQISPSLNGQLYTSDKVAINADHRFTERLKSELQVSYSNNSFPYPNGTPVTQNFVQVGTDLSYNLTKNFIVSASYNYQLRSLAGGNYAGTAYAGTQDNHNVSVSLRYDFEPLHY